MRIVEWLQQLPRSFTDWNEDNFGVENSNCKEFQPAENNRKRMPARCISNFPLKENACARYDLISLPQTYSIPSEVVNSDCIYSKNCLSKEQNTIASSSIRNVTQRTLNPRKPSTSYKRLQQRILKSIEKFKKVRDKRERKVSSCVNIAPKNYVIDLTALKSVSPQQASTTDAFSKKRKSNKILGTEKYQEKFLMINNLSKDKSKNQENKSKVCEDSKLPNIGSIQTTSKQNLYELRNKNYESPVTLLPAFITGTSILNIHHDQLAKYVKCHKIQSSLYDIHKKFENGIDVVNITSDLSSQFNLNNFKSRDNFVTKGNISHEQLNAKSDVLYKTSRYQMSAVCNIHGEFINC